MGDLQHQQNQSLLANLAQTLKQTQNTSATTYNSPTMPKPTIADNVSSLLNAMKSTQQTAPINPSMLNLASLLTNNAQFQVPQQIPQFAPAVPMQQFPMPKLDAFPAPNIDSMLMMAGLIVPTMGNTSNLLGTLAAAFSQHQTRDMRGSDPRKDSNRNQRQNDRKFSGDKKGKPRKGPMEIQLGPGPACLPSYSDPSVPADSMKSRFY
jgi:hypothetical protein